MRKQVPRRSIVQGRRLRPDWPYLLCPRGQLQRRLQGSPDRQPELWCVRNCLSRRPVVQQRQVRAHPSHLHSSSGQLQRPVHEPADRQQ